MGGAKKGVALFVTHKCRA